MTEHSEIFAYKGPRSFAIWLYFCRRIPRTYCQNIELSAICLFSYFATRLFGSSALRLRIDPTLLENGIKLYAKLSQNMRQWLQNDSWDGFGAELRPGRLQDGLWSSVEHNRRWLSMWWPQHKTPNRRGQVQSLETSVQNQRKIKNK